MGYLTLLNFYLIALLCGNGYTENRAFTKEPALWSLRCLYAGEDRCTSALSDYVLPDTKNVTFQELEDLFDYMDQDVQKAFIERDLGRLSSQLVCKIPKSLLLIIPEKQLSLMRGDILGKLLECNQDDQAIVRLIGSSIESVQDPYSFYTTIQSKNLKDNVVSILGDSIKSMSSIKSAQWLVSENNSVLEYLSPNMILDAENNLLHWIRNIDADNWSRRPQRVKRIWAVALKRHILPQTFSDWDDSTILSKGHFLLGSTVQELEELSPDLIQDKATLYQFPFSVVQARGVFGYFNRYLVLHRNVYEESKNLMYQLLPRHLQQFYEESLNLTELSRLKELKSLATSRQIVEYMVRNNNGMTIQDLVSTKDGLMEINHLLYCVPLNVFYQLNYTLTFHEALNLQHHKLSQSQLYVLTSGGTAYQLSLMGVDGAQDILRGLPTVLLSGGVPNTVYLYLMPKVPGSVPPRTAALLQHFIYKSDNKRNHKSVFRNKDAKDFFSFLPSKYIQRNHESLLSYILENPRIANVLPEYVLSVILTGTGRNFSYSNSSVSNSLAHPVLLRGLDCADVKNMSPLDFIHVISSFNSMRLSFGWAFPKNLQQCSLNKLVEYLEMKSAFMTYYLTNSLVSLMTSSDVEAVGGFVLAGLPLKELRIAPQRDLMVKVIGQLSLPELLVASNMEKLMDIGDLYFRANMGKDLFNLGNLTAFLAAPNIEAIRPQDFKLMLESGLLDRRACVPDNQRDSWSNLILEAFGSAAKWEAQDLVTLGDLLLVIPHHDLIKVDPRVWAEVADLLANTGYFEVLHLLDEPVVFYELCEKLMPDPYEATTFRKELVEFVGWIVTAAQHQMNSVVTASSLKRGTRVSPLSMPKTSKISSASDETAEGENTNIWDSLSPFSFARSSSHQGLISKVSCDAIRIVGKPSELYLTSKIIDEMGQEEVENCRDEFAKMDLPKETASQIWKQLDKKRSPHLAGKLLSQASPTDLLGWNLSFEKMWAHETIYYLTNYNHNNDTISALVETINKHKQSILSVEQVVALGPLTCQVTDVKITGNVFFQASRHLGTTLPCDLRCLQYFEPSFQNVDAFGPIAEWTPEDVESLGILIAGLNLEDWMKLVDSEKQLLSRIGTRALQCLPKKHLQALSESAVRQLPATSSALLKREFSFLLNSSVGAVLDDHLTPSLDFNSPALTQIIYTWEDHRYVPHVIESSGSLNQPLPLISASLFTLCYYRFL
uniref:Otoancorin n=1 Tax=Lygus hesperus TaxID=30085 RepID=A0A0A9Z7M3_LYGHE